MKKFQNVIFLAVVGLLAGVIIAEFFPKLLQGGFLSGVGNALSEPFSQYRNELAVKYGLFGGAIGAVIGVVLMLVGGKK